MMKRIIIIMLLLAGIVGAEWINVYTDEQIWCGNIVGSNINLCTFNASGFVDTDTYWPIGYGLQNKSNILTIDSSILNSTIDARSVSADTDTHWPYGFGLSNESSVLVVNSTLLNNTINALDSDTIYNDSWINATLYIDGECLANEYVYNISGNIAQCRADVDTDTDTHWPYGFGLQNDSDVLVVNSTLINDTINSLDSDTFVEKECGVDEYIYNITSDTIYCRTDVSGGVYIPLWSDLAKTTSNSSINSGNVEVSGTFTTDDIYVDGAEMITIDSSTNNIVLRLNEGSNAVTSASYVITYAGTTEHWWFGDGSSGSDNFYLVNNLGDISFRVEGDVNDFGVFGVASNIFSFSPNTDNDGTLGTDSYRWADVKAVLIQGADICFDGNSFCFTECVTNDSGVYKEDVCVVTEKPTKDMLKTIALYSIDTYQDYVDVHTTWIDINHTYGYYEFDNSMNESNFNYRKTLITIDGKNDFLLGRTNRGSLRDIKRGLNRLDAVETRLDAIEQTLCNYGANQYC